MSKSAGWTSLSAGSLVLLLTLTGQPRAVAQSEVRADPFVAAFDRPSAQLVRKGLSGPQVPASASGGGLVVDDDLAECPAAAFTTIQSAVDAAAVQAGSQTIFVCAGTYPENVSIGPGNPLRLKGDRAGSTIITGVAGSAGPIINVVAAGRVDISRLTVDGGSALAGGTVVGIRYDETDGQINEVEVLNIRNASGSSQGLGVLIESTTGGRAKVAVRRSLVENYTRVGINGNGFGVDLTVESTNVVGPTPPTVWAPNGVQISRGAIGKVHDNFLDNNPSPNVPGGAGSGIILFCPGSTGVHRNVVTRADLGIALVDAAGAKVHNNDVVDNEFDGISLQFLGLFFGNIGCTAPGAPLPVEANHIHNNRVIDSGDIGIRLANFDAATDPNTPNDNRVRNNRIETSASDGIHVFAGVDNEIKNNRMNQSGNLDAADDTSGGGTAGTGNIWKNNKCSTSSPTGLCK